MQAKTDVKMTYWVLSFSNLSMTLCICHTVIESKWGCLCTLSKEQTNQGDGNNQRQGVELGAVEVYHLMMRTWVAGTDGNEAWS